MSAASPLSALHSSDDLDQNTLPALAVELTKKDLLPGTKVIEAELCHQTLSAWMRVWASLSPLSAVGLITRRSLVRIQPPLPEGTRKGVFFV